MSTIIYRFDHAESYPLLDSFSTVKGVITTSVQGHGDDAALVVRASHVHVDTDDQTIVLALPPRAIEIAPKDVYFEIIGDHSGCRPFLDVVDGDDQNVKLIFDPVNFTGKKKCAIIGSQIYSESKFQSGNDIDIVPPLTFYRFGLIVTKPVQKINLKLLALYCVSNARLINPGLT